MTSLLPYQFKNSPKLNGFLNTFYTQLGELETSIKQVKRHLPIEFLGRIVGQERNNLTDEEFLAWIKVRIKLNNSSGTVKDLFSILEILQIKFLISEYWPNVVEITIIHSHPIQNLHADWMPASAGMTSKKEIFNIIKSCMPICAKTIIKKASSNFFRFDFNIGELAEYEQA